MLSCEAIDEGHHIRVLDAGLVQGIFQGVGSVVECAENVGTLARYGGVDTVWLAYG